MPWVIGMVNNKELTALQLQGVQIEVVPDDKFNAFLNSLGPVEPGKDKYYVVIWVDKPYWQCVVPETTKRDLCPRCRVNVSPGYDTEGNLLLCDSCYSAVNDEFDDLDDEEDPIHFFANLDSDIFIGCLTWEKEAQVTMDYIAQAMNAVFEDIEIKFLFTSYVNLNNGYEGLVFTRKSISESQAKQYLRLCLLQIDDYDADEDNK